MAYFTYVIAAGAIAAFVASFFVTGLFGSWCGAEMHFTSTLKILLLASLSLSVAAGASAQHVQPLVVQEPMPLMLAQGLEPVLKPHPAPELKLETPVARRCVCTMQYDPVCARRQDGIEATYSNACQAQCERATVTRRGRC